MKSQIQNFGMKMIKEFPTDYIQAFPAFVSDAA